MSAIFIGSGAHNDCIQFSDNVFEGLTGPRIQGQTVTHDSKRDIVIGHLPASFALGLDMALGIGVNNKALVIAIGAIQASALQTDHFLFDPFYPVKYILRYSIAEIGFQSKHLPRIREDIQRVTVFRFRTLADISQLCQANNQCGP